MNVRFQHRAFRTFAVMTFFVLATHSSVRADALKPAEREALQTDLRRLKEAYRHWKVVGTFTTYAAPARIAAMSKTDLAKLSWIDPETQKRAPLTGVENLPMRKVSFVYQRQGDLKSIREQPVLLMRIDPKDAEGPVVRPVPADSKAPRETATCLGERYRFKVIWPGNGGNPSLADFENGSGSVDEAPFQMVETRIYAPVSCENLDIAELLSDPLFVIEKVEPITDHGQPCVKYSFSAGKQFPATATKKAFVAKVVGWFICNPQEANALRAAWVGTEAGQPRANLTIEYAGMKDGIPVPKRIVDLRENLPTTIHDLETVELGQLPKDRFLLSSFGLPEPAVEQLVVRQQSYTLWLILGSALLIVAAIAVRYYSTRPQAKGG